MKKKARLRIFIDVLLAIVGIFLILLCSKFDIYKKDYTNSYTVYKDIKEYKITAELKDYLKEKKIEYTISEGKLKINDDKLIEFLIYPDKSCRIIPNSTLQNFELLDEGTFSSVVTYGTVVDNEIVEEVSLVEDGVRYNKVLGRYYSYKIHDCMYTITLSVVFLCISITLLVLDIVTSISKKKKNNRKHI